MAGYGGIGRWQSGQKQQEDLQLTVMVGERIVDLLLNIRKAEVAEGSEVPNPRPQCKPSLKLSSALS